MDPKTIVVIGTVNVDTTLILNRVPVAGESVKTRDYKQSTGGKGANSSIASFRSCHRKVPADDENNQHKYVTALPFGEETQVHLVAAIGDDPNGKLCRDNLEQNGIDISNLREIKGQMTGMSVCVVEQDTGQNRVMSHRGANDSHETKDYMSADLWAGGVRPDLLISHQGLPLSVVEQILKTAGEAGIDILLNATPAQPILKRLYKYVTHFVINETEAAILSGRDVRDVTKETCPQIAKIFLKKGVKNVVITLGEHGAYYARNGETGGLEDGHIPAYDVTVLDTTGAGDTFVGTYASSYVYQKSHKAWDIRSAVESASAASACSIGAIGAQSAIPWADQIERLVARRSEALECPANEADLHVQANTTVEDPFAGLGARIADHALPTEVFSEGPGVRPSLTVL